MTDHRRAAFPVWFGSGRQVGRADDANGLEVYSARSVAEGASEVFVLTDRDDRAPFPLRPDIGGRKS